MNNKITSLYNKYKNTPKKLKIVCDWDEVIQPCEPCALWKVIDNKEYYNNVFEYFFKDFWKENLSRGFKGSQVEYSPYGSKLKDGNYFGTQQKEIKISPDFYNQAPFLTIAEDLLRLIREDKVERLIFLSACDKRKFPNRDERKIEIFGETFGNPSKWAKIIGLQLIPFDNENQGPTKADWIKENAPNFDIFIDDNPNICRSVVKNYLPRRSCGKCNKILTIESASGYEMADDGFNISYAICQNKNCQKECDNFWKIADVRGSYNNEDEYWNSEVDYTHYPTVIRKMNKPPITVLAPYYPATANQHDERVLLIKNEVSNLKKEDFK